MKVILTDEVTGLGSIGSIVQVKNGYGRNYLIPRNLAVVANESNQKELDHKKRILKKKREKLLEEKRVIAKKIENLSITIHKQVGTDERIFGSVTTAEIATLLEKEGINLVKKDIHITEEIKKIGVYNAEVKLHTEVIAKLKIWVVAQPQE